jgi:hypothetical protein
MSYVSTDFQSSFRIISTSRRTLCKNKDQKYGSVITATAFFNLLAELSHCSP